MIRKKINYIYEKYQRQKLKKERQEIIKKIEYKIQELENIQQTNIKIIQEFILEENK